jgi:hypothetical protein
VREVHCRHPRSAMEKKENWILSVRAANQNVLPTTAEQDLLQ